MTYQFDPILGVGRDGKVTLAEQQAGFNSGTPAQQAAFQASVSGDVKLAGRTFRAATYGSNSSEIYTTSLYPATVVSPVVAVFPASGSTVYNNGYAALGNTYPNARFVANGGISGQTTTQMLARDSAALSAGRRGTADVLAQYPDVIFTDLPINDFGGITAGTYASVLTTVKANTRTILSRLLSSSAIVIDSGAIGYSGADPQAALVRQALLEYNNWLATSVVAEFGASGYVYLPMLDVTYNATGNFLPGMSADGTNPTARCNVARDALRYAYLAPIYGIKRGAVFGRNYIANANFAALSAVAYGSIATGFDVSGGGTRSNASVAIREGRVWQTTEVRGLGSGTVVAIAIPCDLMATATGMTAALALTATEIPGVECDVMIESLDAGTPLAFTWIKLSIAFAAGTGTVYSTAAVSAHPAASGVQKFTCHLASPDVLPGVAQAAITSSLAVLQFSSDITCPNVRVGISKPRISKA